MFVKEEPEKQATQAKPDQLKPQKKVRAKKIQYASKEEFERRFMDVGKQYEPVKTVDDEKEAAPEEHKSDDSDADFIVQNIESN